MIDRGRPRQPEQASLLRTSNAFSSSGMLLNTGKYGITPRLRFLRAVSSLPAPRHTMPAISAQQECRLPQWRDGWAPRGLGSDAGSSTQGSGRPSVPSRFWRGCRKLRGASPFPSSSAWPDRNPYNSAAYVCSSGGLISMRDWTPTPAFFSAFCRVRCSRSIGGRLDSHLRGRNLSWTSWRLFCICGFVTFRGVDWAVAVAGLVDLLLLQVVAFLLEAASRASIVLISG